MFNLKLSKQLKRSLKANEAYLKLKKVVKSCETQEQVENLSFWLNDLKIEQNKKNELLLSLAHQKFRLFKGSAKIKTSKTKPKFINSRLEPFNLFKNAKKIG